MMRIMQMKDFMRMNTQTVNMLNASIDFITIRRASRILTPITIPYIQDTACTVVMGDIMDMADFMILGFPVVTIADSVLGSVGV